MSHETQALHIDNGNGPYLGTSAYFMMLGATLISLLGTLMTDFALGQWVYKQTQSATAYGVIGFAALAPQLLFSPFIGTLLDRYPRGTLMVLGHVGAGVCTLSLVMLYANELLNFWCILMFVGIGSVFNGFISQSFIVLVPVLIEEKKLLKFQGFTQGGMGLVELVVPALAAFFLVAVGLKGVFIADIISFVSAITVLLFIVKKINHSDGRSVPSGETLASLQQQLKSGLRYLFNHHQLRNLLLFMGAINFAVGIVHVLLTPLVLSFSTVVELGTVLTAAGVGTLSGSIALLLLKDSEEKTSLLCGLLLMMGLLLLSAAFIFVEPRLTVWILAGTVLLLTMLFVMAESVNQVIWQTSVPKSLQGRVISIQTLISQISLPLAFLLAGPLADYVFEPLFAVDGPVADSLGQVIGVGPGRGIVFFYGVCGLAIIASVGLFYNTVKRQ
ncbi:MFS transporter [Vibrio ostreicida]|uniref:MFS transporter n=1 Tax=Vibrio ostreicida TaxID=526588 RepID=A0ABT8BTS7_9VIBR|nr:MFS transporter [Vibrio ostreicida]MDN3610396.1 MFS transporter [Vibrio ostreicida]NPD07594.1 MFS transporter [Vibrio ostreicida]